MSNFKNFVQAVQTQLAAMSTTGLYEVGLTKDEVWNTYLDSFPEGTNLIYKERREYDCNCCSQFIRDVGRVVTIVDNKLVSLWDIQVEGYYQPVADALAKLVKSAAVTDVFVHPSSKVGVASNNVMQEDGQVKTWNHFHAVVPALNVKREDAIASFQGEVRNKQGVLKRGLETLTLESAEIVLELIDQNSLYRGEEHRAAVAHFIEMKKEFDALPQGEADNFIWVAYGKSTFQPIRNTSIGTMLVDLSEGMDLEDAVKRFEKVVAPANYKRPTAIVSKSMIENAEKAIDALGLTDSLPRRYATEADLNINNVLFADRAVKKSMSVFDDMKGEVKVATKSLDKVEEISISDFIANVIPKAHSLEVMVENSHANNLFSLIAPVNAGAPNLFKWGNPFSWSYNGEVAASIKERVKSAGGNVDGEMRISLSWFNNDDLDLHVHEPNGEHIYFHHRNSTSGGMLDIDMNGLGGMSPTRTPVENVFWRRASSMREGVYTIVVNNYSAREMIDVGFEMEIEFKGQKYNFVYDKKVSTGQNIVVAKVKYSHANGLEIVESIGQTTLSKDLWGIKTQTFVPVTMVMNSPNHWDGEETGNRHYFFMLKGCQNPSSTRGFYNEYLKSELNEHRKVLEILGSKLRVEHSPEQVSGIGFESTVRNHLLVKVGGSFNRTLKIVF
ncbi:hypothetical protein G646_gp084 [Serratia phage phiMAM1]|uniref:Uncharacterized protein n=1 Tax=Serratia phage phiMAM1 TaxID=1262513 RepID=K7YB38_9CAUD|nr:hypothetical protein G646_gp084 [Serratia phage phiMAM1]AFX93552.1 hypothetical protein MAM_084 [Serratia phage phiMAM1]